MASTCPKRKFPTEVNLYLFRVRDTLYFSWGPLPVKGTWNWSPAIGIDPYSLGERILRELPLHPFLRSGNGLTDAQYNAGMIQAVGLKTRAQFVAEVRRVDVEVGWGAIVVEGFRYLTMNNVDRLQENFEVDLDWAESAPDEEVAKWLGESVSTMFSRLGSPLEAPFDDVESASRKVGTWAASFWPLRGGVVHVPGVTGLAAASRLLGVSVRVWEQVEGDLDSVGDGVLVSVSKAGLTLWGADPLWGDRLALWLADRGAGRVIAGFCDERSDAASWCLVENGKLVRSVRIETGEMPGAAGEPTGAEAELGMMIVDDEVSDLEIEARCLRGEMVSALVARWGVEVGRMADDLDRVPVRFLASGVFDHWPDPFASP